MKILYRNQFMLVTRWQFRQWRFRVSLRNRAVQVDAGPFSVVVG